MKFKLFIIATLMMTFGLTFGVSAQTTTTSADADLVTETNVQVKPVAATMLNAQMKPVALSNQSVFTSATLRPGMKSEAVRLLQEILKEKGYYTLGIDGSYGPGTKAAVRQFQAAQGLSTDGIAGARTFAKFVANTGITPSPAVDADGVACTREYEPVCGQMRGTINCITSPCPEPAPETYGNSCMAKAAGVEVLYEGACDVIKPVNDADEEGLSDNGKRQLIIQLEAKVERIKNYLEDLEAKIERIKDSL